MNGLPIVGCIAPSVLLTGLLTGAAWAGEYTLMLSELGSRRAPLESRCLSGVTGIVRPYGSAGMLLRSGGVGIFQLPPVGTNTSLLDLGELSRPNSDLARVVVRRMKSVLVFCAVMGIGSEMPRMVPFPPREIG